MEVLGVNVSQFGYKKHAYFSRMLRCKGGLKYSTRNQNHEVCVRFYILNELQKHEFLQAPI